MATSTTAMKTAMATARRDHFANGTLEVQASGGAVLATFGLTAAGGTISNGVWTLAYDNATVQASATGTAAYARLKTSGGVADIHTMSVTGTGGGGDVEIDNVALVSGQDFTMNTSTLAE